MNAIGACPLKEAIGDQNEKVARLHYHAPRLVILDVGENPEWHTVGLQVRSRPGRCAVAENGAMTCREKLNHVSSRIKGGQNESHKTIIGEILVHQMIDARKN